MTIPDELPTPISTDGPPVDVPLLRKAVEWAEAEAARPEVDSQWWQKSYVVSGLKLGRTCGTAYCIAGYVVALVDGPEEAERLNRDGWGMGAAWVANRASALLGLTDDEAIPSLFVSNNSITDVREVAEQIAARAGERL